MPRSVNFTLPVTLAKSVSSEPIPTLTPGLIRVPRWRLVNLAALVLWAALAVLALAQNLDPPSWVAAALAAIAVYFVIVGLLRQRS